MTDTSETVSEVEDIAERLGELADEDGQSDTLKKGLQHAKRELEVTAKMARNGSEA